MQFEAKNPGEGSDKRNVYITVASSNGAPTAITLGGGAGHAMDPTTRQPLGFFGPFQTSECMMPENAPVDTEVGELFTQDPDGAADTHTYTMTDNGGGLFKLGSGADNNKVLVAVRLGSPFLLLLLSLTTPHLSSPPSPPPPRPPPLAPHPQQAPANYEALSSAKQVTFTVRSTDSGSLTVDRTFTVDVTDANDAPTDIALSATTIGEDSYEGTSIGSLTVTDADAAVTSSYVFGCAANNGCAGGKFGVEMVRLCDKEGSYAWFGSDR